MSDQPRSLSQSIKAFRKAHRLSQDEVAESVGVHRQAVSNWERGVHEPTARNLEDLAKLFGTTSQLLRSGFTPPAATRGRVVREQAARGYSALAVPVPRMPPSAYNLVYEYCMALERAGVPEQQIEEARRLMSGTTFNTLNKYTSDPRDEAGWIKDIRAAWAFIRDVLKPQGYDL